MEKRRLWRAAALRIVALLVLVLAIAMTIGGISSLEYAIIAVTALATVVGVVWWRQRGPSTPA
jgi:4-amino-4-deoxy-L-arabinose transferase-like glycosyltransferase